MPRTDSSPTLSAAAVGTASDAPAISSKVRDRGLTFKQLLLLACLLAAGFALNATAGKVLADILGGPIAPEFIVAALCLAILYIRPDASQALAIGIIAAAVAQATTTFPGIDFLAEGIAALVMAFIVRTAGGSEGKLVPVVGSFVTTLCSGCIFMGTRLLAPDLSMNALADMLQVVVLASLCNAILVGVLYRPVKSLLKVD